MKNVKYDVVFVEKASRLELFIRWFWAIPTIIVLFFLEVVFSFALMFQWLSILFIGKRNGMLQEWILKFVSYTTKFTTYLYLLTDERNPIMPGDMKDVKYDVTFVEGAGRLELFIRWFWTIPTYIVAIFLTIIGMFIANSLQWLYILILGKRHKALHDWIFKSVAYDTKFMTYIYLLTDERNPIMPED